MDSNPEPPEWQARILPLWPCHQFENLEGNLQYKPKKIKYMLMVFTVALIENQNVLLLSVTVLKVTSTKALPAGFVEEGSLRESEEMMME